MEYFDVLDEKGKKKGYTIARGLPANEGDYLGIVNVLVFYKNKFLVTKRHPEKTSPNMWEITGGGILAGEEVIDAAIRELKEETGISRSKEDFIFLGAEISSCFYASLFLVKLDKMPKIVLQENETVDYKWIEIDEFFNNVSAKDFLPYLGLRLLKYKSLVLDNINS